MRKEGSKEGRGKIGKRREKGGMVKIGLKNGGGTIKRTKEKFKFQTYNFKVE